MAAEASVGAMEEVAMEVVERAAVPLAAATAAEIEVEGREAEWLVVLTAVEQLVAARLAAAGVREGASVVVVRAAAKGGEGRVEVVVPAAARVAEATVVAATAAAGLEVVEREAEVMAAVARAAAARAGAARAAAREVVATGAQVVVAAAATVGVVPTGRPRNPSRSPSRRQGSCSSALRSMFPRKS